MYDKLMSAAASTTYLGQESDACRPARRLEALISEAEQLVQMAIDARVMLSDNLDRLAGSQPSPPETAQAASLAGCEISELGVRIGRLRSNLIDIREHALRLASI